MIGEACWSSGLPSSVAELVKCRPSDNGAFFASCNFQAIAFRIRVMEASLTRRLKSTSGEGAEDVVFYLVVGWRGATVDEGEVGVC